MKKWLILACGTGLTIAGCSSGSGAETGSGGAAGNGGAGGTASGRSCATDIGVGEVQPFGDPVATETVTSCCSSLPTEHSRSSPKPSRSSVSQVIQLESSAQASKRASSC